MRNLDEGSRGLFLDERKECGKIGEERVGSTYILLAEEQAGRLLDSCRDASATLVEPLIDAFLEVR